MNKAMTGFISDYADAPDDPGITQPVIIEDQAPVQEVKTYVVPNRHDRRRQAALARKERKAKQKGNR